MKGDQKGSATVLACKDKVWAFKETVGEDNELPHKGDESEVFGFAYAPDKLNRPTG